MVTFPLFHKEEHNLNYLSLLLYRFQDRLQRGALDNDSLPAFSLGGHPGRRVCNLDAHGVLVEREVRRHPTQLRGQQLREFGALNVHAVIRIDLVEVLAHHSQLFGAGLHTFTVLPGRTSQAFSPNEGRYF